MEPIDKAETEEINSRVFCASSHQCGVSLASSSLTRPRLAETLGMAGGMTSLSVAALELLAFFGFMCILCTILLPMLAFLLRFVLVEVPRQWRNVLLHRAQQRELRRLQRRVDVLTRRKQAVSTHESTSLTFESPLEQCLQEAQESRRRAKTASAAHKQEWTEETPTKGTADGRFDLGLACSDQNNLWETNSSMQERAFTPAHQRHRLSIHSTVKKAARSGH